MSSCKNIIYALTDPRTNEWRYIGLSTRGLARPRAHLSPYNLANDTNKYKLNWINQLKKIGLIPNFQILEEFDSSDFLKYAEMEWIAEARRQGIRLTNLTDGGDWVYKQKTILPRKMSEETKAKISKGNTGKIASLEKRKNLSNAKMGTKLSEETRLKISKTKKGILVGPMSQTQKDNISKATLGKFVSEETKKNNRWLILVKNLLKIIKLKFHLQE